jgi:hypothetical protein
MPNQGLHYQIVIFQFHVGFKSAHIYESRISFMCFLFPTLLVPAAAGKYCEIMCTKAIAGICHL